MQHLAEYNKVVEDVKNGAISSTSTLGVIDLREIKDLPPDIIALRAARLSNGTVAVEFLRSNDGRIHKGYLFKDFQDSDAGADQIMRMEQRFELHQVEGNWYRFSD